MGKYRTVDLKEINEYLNQKAYGHTMETYAGDKTLDDELYRCIAFDSGGFFIDLGVLEKLAVKYAMNKAIVC